MRIDKYIWAVRLCKTRSVAAKLCISEKVQINGEVCKASKTVKIGDEIAIKSIPVWRHYSIINLPKSRMGAKFVPDYLKETTSEEHIQLIEQVQESNRQNRLWGLKGRPTKRDRRQLERYKS